MKNLKHGDKVVVNFGVIKNMKAIVNWVENYTDENGHKLCQVWLKNVEPIIMNGWKGNYKFTKNVVPISWIVQ